MDDARTVFEGGYLVPGPPGIEDGAPAGLVGYREDPRQDVEEPRRPAVIILNGQQIR